MLKKNHYKLIEHLQKEKLAKVFNFKKKRVEIYYTVLTRLEKEFQKKRRLELRLELEKEKKRLKKERKIEGIKQAKIIRKCRKKVFYFLYLYLKYKKLKFLVINDSVNSVIINRYSKFVKKLLYSNKKLSNSSLYRLVYKLKLKRSFLKLNKYKEKCPTLDIISVYVILRQTNIFVTIVKDNKIAKVLSPCIFRHIPKSGRKLSASYFYTVKRTIMYISRFFYNKQKKYYLKIYFKGFRKFRRPLLSRFLSKWRLRVRCLGIYNLDFESFNGCRLRKSKRIKIRGQRKQKNKFSF